MDITLKTDSGYFNYRVGAIIIYENNLLMVKNNNSPFYYSVGGRVKFGETSENAVLREVYEETQINSEIERLAFIHENFFVGDFIEDTNISFHEIALFYLMKPHESIKNIKCERIDTNEFQEFLCWLPIDKLPDYNIYPEFFKTELQNLINSVSHFVTKNEKTIRVK